MVNYNNRPLVPLMIAVCYAVCGSTQARSADAGPAAKPLLEELIVTARFA